MFTDKKTVQKHTASRTEMTELYLVDSGRTTPVTGQALSENTLVQLELEARILLSTEYRQGGYFRHKEGTK